MGNGIERMMEEKKKEEDKMKVKHALRDAFSKMEGGPQLLGYNSKDEMWADSLDNSLARIDAKKIAGALGLQQQQGRRATAEASMFELEAADTPRRLQDAATNSKLNQDILGQSLLEKMAEADARAKALEQRGGFLRAFTGMSSDMPMDRRVTAAAQQFPEVLMDGNNRDFAAGLQSLFRQPAQPYEFKAGDSSFVVHGQSILPVKKGAESSELDKARIEKLKVETEKLKAENPDPTPGYQATADVLMNLKNAGVKRVDMDASGKVSVNKGSWIGGSGVSIDDAIADIYQRSGGKVKFGATAAQDPTSMPKRVKQNGVVFEQDPKTGKYNPVK